MKLRTTATSGLNSISFPDNFNTLSLAYRQKLTYDGLGDFRILDMNKRKSPRRVRALLATRLFAGLFGNYRKSPALFDQRDQLSRQNHIFTDRMLRMRTPSIPRFFKGEIVWNGKLITPTF